MNIISKLCGSLLIAGALFPSVIMAAELEDKDESMVASMSLAKGMDSMVALDKSPVPELDDIGGAIKEVKDFMNSNGITPYELDKRGINEACKALIQGGRLVDILSKKFDIGKGREVSGLELMALTRKWFTKEPAEHYPTPVSLAAEDMLTLTYYTNRQGDIVPITIYGLLYSILGQLDNIAGVGNTDPHIGKAMSTIFKLFQA